jgi:hypothetical protein
MFNGDEFRQFAEHMGFKHRKITPLWPRANSECEKNDEEYRKGGPCSKYRTEIGSKRFMLFYVITEQRLM